MDNYKIVLIGIMILIIVSVIIVMLANTDKYERIEITSNGTSIDVPHNQTKYHGDVDGVKIWNWDDGALVTLNSQEAGDGIKIGVLSFNTLNKLITRGNFQVIDGFTCYKINADELIELYLFDIIKVDTGKFYCISLTNETTQDNIIICCKDKNKALHIAKSVHYKDIYPNNINRDNNYTIKEIAEDLLSNTSVNL